MHQVVFRIPISIPNVLPDGIPIYGFGTMLCLAIFLGTWLAARRARREGVSPDLIYDVSLWIIVAGIVGARIVYVFAEAGWDEWQRFFFIWEGGLVFYGSAIGGVVGYLLAYFFLLRKQNVSSWQLADILAPSIALGLCLGRIGCYLNGCCYGNIASPDCPAVHFPMPSPPRFVLTDKGYQTAAGFTVVDDGVTDRRTVALVEPGSPADEAGLKAGDVIIQADEVRVSHYDDLVTYLRRDWPRGKERLALTVRRGNEDVALAPFSPRTIGLHPTQLYESVSTFLLFLLVTAYYPLRKRQGEVMIVFMIGYAVHRFLNEMLRNDTDPVAFGMTLSQNGSILVLVAALVLALMLRSRPAALGGRTDAAG